jgi:twitching motility protein PilT
MQGGKKFGMQTLNDALYQLYLKREVTREEVLRVSSDRTSCCACSARSPSTRAPPPPTPGKR